MSWKKKACATSARKHYVDLEPSLKRRMGNRAISLYLKTLGFPSDSILNSFISCTSCFRIQGDDFKRWDGVVMDGTATGILEKLSTFHNPKEVIQAIKNV